MNKHSAGRFVVNMLWFLSKGCQEHTTHAAVQRPSISEEQKAPQINTASSCISKYEKSFVNGTAKPSSWAGPPAPATDPLAGNHTSTKHVPAAANLGCTAEIKAVANFWIHVLGLMPASNTVSGRKFWLQLNRWQKSRWLQQARISAWFPSPHAAAHRALAKISADNFSAALVEHYP